MSVRIFHGDLYYQDSSEKLEVESLVVRDNQIGFSVTSITGDGRYRASGTATLGRKGAYEVSGLEARDGSVRCDTPWDIEFRITPDGTDYLIVSGILKEGHYEYPFEGELERTSR